MNEAKDRNRTEHVICGCSGHPIGRVCCDDETVDKKKKFSEEFVPIRKYFLVEGERRKFPGSGGKTHKEKVERNIEMRPKV